jgi:protein-S-isoprenylcysteine O-methyltransferase Ste14
VMDEFHSTKLGRKKRRKWWGDHVVLAYVVLTGIFAFIYVAIAASNKHLPGWLASLGVTPSGVNLVMGTLSCTVGVWGIRKQKENGLGWLVLYVLCLLSGMLMLGRAFAIF